VTGKAIQSSFRIRTRKNRNIGMEKDKDINVKVDRKINVLGG
jgi:hypothetical protein